MSAPDSGDVDRLPRGLRWRRALTRAALLFERLWPALWPAVGVAGAFLCAALLELPQRLPPWVHAGLLAGVALAVLALGIRGLRRLAAPDDAAADRRLERVSGLPHRPLAVLADRPARADPATAALWQAHVARAAGMVRRLKVGLPHPGLARQDRLALRGGLVVALVASLVIAGADAPARLAEAMRPDLPIAPATPAAQLQAWVTPPAYTGQPPLFLKAEDRAVAVPSGSLLTTSLTGGGPGEPPVLALDGQTAPFRTLDPSSFQGDLEIRTGGRLTVRRSGQTLAAWDLTAVADQAPVVAWAEPPGPAPRGLQVRLPWQVSDDYGVVQLQAEARLRDRPDAPPLTLTIPLPGGTAKSAKGINSQDLTAHPWAGLSVTARLLGRDAAGLTGQSEEAGFTLPERAFRHPVARALIEVRKGLSLAPEDRVAAVGRLDGLLIAPQALGADLSAFLNLADIYYRLVRGRGPDAVAEAQRLMWELALHLEEGGSERTARALEAAREAVRDALDRATRAPNEANRSELDRRLQELEAAIKRHLEALIEQARRDNAEVPYDPDARRLDSRDMDRAAEAAREAARQGRMDEARQRMAELEQMLDQLRNARPEHGAADRKNAEKSQRGRQQMGALQDMIGREGSLLDHAQSRAGQDGAGQNPLPSTDARRGRPRSAPPEARSPQPGGDPGRETDRRVQQALRRALGELMQQFGDLTGEVPQSLGEADAAMREAGQALGAGQDDAAGRAQQRAIEALQKGGREMSQQMAKQFGPGATGEGDEGGDSAGMSGLTLQDGRGERSGTAQGTLPGQRGRGDKRDPLGRQLGQGTAGLDESDSVRVPEEMERQRTRAIQDELRRRGAERARPQPELDYIDRLLKQF